MSKGKVVVLAVVAAAAVILVFYPRIANWIRYTSTKGTIHIALQLEKPEDGQLDDQLREQCIDVVRKRLDRFHVLKSEIVPNGHDEIRITCPAVWPPEVIGTLVAIRGDLRLRMVQPLVSAEKFFKKLDEEIAKMPELQIKTGELEFEGQLGSGPLSQYLEAKGFCFGVLDDDHAIVDAMLSYPEIEDLVPQGWLVRWSASPELISGRNEWHLYPLDTEVVVSNGDIIDALPSLDAKNKPVIDFEVDDSGAGVMRNVTSKNVGRALAICLDNKVLAAPKIQSEIENKGRIDMGSSSSFLDARVLSAVIAVAPYPTRVNLVEVYAD